MKNIQNFSLFFLITSLAFLGCKKDSTQPSGSLNTTNNSSSDFIEFKIDGTQYRIEEIQSATANSIGVVGQYDSTYNSGTGLTNHIASIHFMNIMPPNTLTDVLWTFFSNQTIAPDTFQYSITGGNMGLPFFQALVQNNCAYSAIDSSSFILNITALQHQTGGKMEGIFSAGNLQLTNSNHVVLSSGHQLTDGKFSVTF
jgi:hypothetical protein